MANNYTQATVHPQIPKALFTEQELETLEENGFSYDTLEDDLLYFYIEEGFDGDETLHLFQQAIERFETSDGLVVEEDVTEIVIEGAFGCTKMRPGEFGGFLIRITKDDIQEAGTGLLLDMFRQGVL